MIGWGFEILVYECSPPCMLRSFKSPILSLEHKKLLTGSFLVVGLMYIAILQTNGYNEAKI